MKTTNVSRKYVPEKFSHLVEITNEMEKVKAKVASLKEDIVLDIIDGWTTGDTLLDFVLVVCNGTFDTQLFQRYQDLSKIGLRNPNQQIIVIQKALREENGELLMLRDVYLAELRPEEVRFDINSQLIHLPVKPQYFLLMHAINRGVILQGHRIVEKEWLTVGVLRSLFNDYQYVYTGEDGFSFVPQSATCDVELLSTADRQSLFTNHAVDAEMLDYLHGSWTRDKSASL